MDGDDGVLENRKGLSDGRDGMDTLSVLCTDRRLTADPSLCMLVQLPGAVPRSSETLLVSDRQVIRIRVEAERSSSVSQARVGGEMEAVVVF